MKENLSQGMTFDSAVNEAVDFAIKDDFLEGFFPGEAHEDFG